MVVSVRRCSGRRDVLLREPIGGVVAEVCAVATDVELRQGRRRGPMSSSMATRCQFEALLRRELASAHPVVMLVILRKRVDFHRCRVADRDGGQRQDVGDSSSPSPASRVVIEPRCGGPGRVARRPFAPKAGSMCAVPVDDDCDGPPMLSDNTLQTCEMPVAIFGPRAGVVIERAQRRSASSTVTSQLWHQLARDIAIRSRPQRRCFDSLGWIT